MREMPPPNAYQDFRDSQFSHFDPNGGIAANGNNPFGGNGSDGGGMGFSYLDSLNKSLDAFSSDYLGGFAAPSGDLASLFKSAG
jgi:hypothetical protein